MDEFKKPYEYQEEKRGLLLLFIILIVSMDIFLALSYTVQVTDVLKNFPALRISFLVIGILFMLFILFTAATCYQLRKNLVTVAKTYLLVRAVFMICSIILIFIRALNDDSILGESTGQYKTFGEMIFIIFIAPLAFLLVFNGLWYLYFLKSKRFKEVQKIN